MADKTVNVLITSFSGLGLPGTLCLPRDAKSSIDDLILEIETHLPHNADCLRLTTASNKLLLPSASPLDSLLAYPYDDFLSLRLSARLCGGKGGFGSQLRAAGGRMSSKRKKDHRENNSSNRNLDGRRLRTINEAKALAEYLAMKPEMEKKEKEERRKRWEQVVEMAERREEEVRNGTKGRVDGKWVEDKEEAGERAREAARAAIQSGDYRDNLQALLISQNDSMLEDEDSDGEGQAERSGSKSSGTSSAAGKGPSGFRTFDGFDEDDEFFSDSDTSQSDRQEKSEEAVVGSVKGKDKA